MKDNKLVDLQESVSYWNEVIDASNAQGGILHGACNGFGSISKDAIRRILSFLNHPTSETWEDCYSVLVLPNYTLWNVWISIDQNAPRSKSLDEAWLCWPDPTVLMNGFHELKSMERASWLTKKHQSERALSEYKRHHIRKLRIIH